jgi:hypothetical protein
VRLISSDEIVFEEHFQDLINAGRLGRRNIGMRAVNDEARVRVVLLEAHIVLGELLQNIVLLYVEGKAKVIEHRDCMIALDFLRHANQ